MYVGLAISRDCSLSAKNSVLARRVASSDEKRWHHSNVTLFPVAIIMADQQFNNFLWWVKLESPSSRAHYFTQIIFAPHCWSDRNYSADVCCCVWNINRSCYCLFVWCVLYFRSLIEFVNTVKSIKARAVNLSVAI